MLFPGMLSRNIVAVRGFASAAAAAAPRSSLLPPTEETVSRLPNGLTVASVDLHGAVSELVIAFRAGSRYEQPDEVGLVHHLRNVIGTDSNNYLGVKLLWQSGSIGSTLISNASKDLLSVQMTVMRTYANVGLSLLGEFSQPAFKAWDVADAASTLHSDLGNQQPFDLIIENLHKAAYRDGPLANSLLAPEQRIGKVGYKQLAAFGNSRMVASQAALIGINVEHSVLLGYASSQGSISQETGAAAKDTRPATYFGGECRQFADTPLAHVAIAGNGGKLTDEKSLATSAVLSYVIGKGSNLKYPNTPSFGVVEKAVAKAANRQAVAISAVNIVHADAGLCGVYIVADGTKITPYIRAAVDALKLLANTGVDAETLAIAKKFAQVDANVSGSNSSCLANDRAAQLLASGSTISPADFTKSIDSVSGEDVKKAAAQLISKLSISAYGKINQVPYVDQL